MRACTGPVSASIDGALACAPASVEVPRFTPAPRLPSILWVPRQQAALRRTDRTADRRSDAPTVFEPPFIRPQTRPAKLEQAVLKRGLRLRPAWASPRSMENRLDVTLPRAKNALMVHDASQSPRIPFGRPTMVGRELDYIVQAVEQGAIAGGGAFMRRCEEWLQTNLPAKRALITHSCTAALEMAAMLADVGPGDEVIMPSFTFSSTATAFVLRGAKPIFVDIRPDTLNIDERLIESAITSRTRVIVPVHYAGVACEMAVIMASAARHGLTVIEDAAQAHLSTYRDQALGTIGHLGCLSFHETKNIISGEGGALIVNEVKLAERAEILREKGTDRSRFFRGEIDKYTWRDIGSSYAPGEIVSAFLFAQLEESERIIARRRAIYEAYRTGLGPLAEAGLVTLPQASGQRANGHIFWLLATDPEDRTRILSRLNADGINAVFHYVPLHSSPAGRIYGRTNGDLRVTDDVAARLIRLPMHLGLTDTDVDRVIAAVAACVRDGR